MIALMFIVAVSGEMTVPPEVPFAVTELVVTVSEPPVTPEISSVPERVLIAAMLLEEAVRLLAPVRFSKVPVASVGAVPPKLLNVTAEAMEFVPAKVKVELPLMVIACEEITPVAVWVRLPPLSVMPPAGMLPSAAKVTVPPLITVPPL